MRTVRLSEIRLERNVLPTKIQALKMQLQGEIAILNEVISKRSKFIQSFVNDEKEEKAKQEHPVIVSSAIPPSSVIHSHVAHQEPTQNHHSNTSTQTRSISVNSATPPINQSKSETKASIVRVNKQKARDNINAIIGILCKRAFRYMDIFRYQKTIEKWEAMKGLFTVACKFPIS